ncbi:leucine-rich repeat-containing protein 42 [Bombina bombina]|uniref:leucine-rich repeat-containing protein 42 n=1 Tax=Bombina bombina TaxID=8345 RepID=UPI00235A7F07|nr:leucine-rich repeat-containing protein 42 [Bombina bombina]
MFGSSESERSEDVGPVYVREKGQLSLLGSQKVVPKTRPYGLFSRGFSVKLCVKQEDTCRHKREPFIFTYTDQGSLRYSAKSLFTLALDLIADNVQHVDSLVGFPEQIAEKLFTAAEARHKFYSPSCGLLALRKFTEAYDDLVLSSLCLRGRYLLVSERLEEIKSFQSLHCLDLSCCKLGDEHELLGHLTTLTSLTELFLKDNCLSDAGLRKMTAPMRVLHRGPEHLTLLDVSCNPNVTDLGVSFLFVFKHLLFLDISETGIKDPRITAQKICTRTGLLQSQGLTKFAHAECRTQGWAEQLVNYWESKVTSAVKPKDGIKFRRAAQQFYGKEMRPPVQNSEISTFPDLKTPKNKLLQFYRPDNSCFPKSNITLSALKRASNNQTPEISAPAPSSKRQRVTLTVADWDLLNKY